MAVVLAACFSTVGCSHPATPNLAPFGTASAVYLTIDDDPSSYHASTTVATLRDVERQQELLRLLSRYDGRWEPVPWTPPWPPASLSATDNDGGTQTIWFGPPGEGAETTLQTKIGEYHYWVDMPRGDFDELLRLMGSPPLRNERGHLVVDKEARRRMIDAELAETRFVPASTALPAAP
ncbi:MAG: hypothetical protein U0836_15080 [Pirellulales bacterium]